MKKIISSLLLCFAFVALIHAQNNEVSYSRLNNVFNLKVKNSAEKLTLTIKGDVKLGDDDKSITSISDEGYIYYRKKGQSLEVEEDGKGNLLYTVNGNKKSTLTAEDKALVEDCVQLLIDYGVDADNRVQRIFAQKGTSGVLSEVERFKSDYVKEMYLSYLLKNQKLSKDEMVTLLNKANQYLSSDYYKAELLDGVMGPFLADEATSNAYLQTVNSISSDYYQSETVKKLLNTSLNEKQYQQVMTIVSNMKSDYYQAEVVKKLLSNNDISDARFAGLMKIAGNMGSDYYKSEIISALLKNKTLNKDRYDKTIAAAQNIKSDYYQYSILSGLIDENITDEAAWSSLIQYAGKIGSDYYQAQMLMKIADKMPDSETLRKQIGDAAKNIKSDYYYGQVMRSLGRRAA
ncbi:hypothetical protein [Parafilimonas terrae]|uniref:HEAT repeat-containing protein n=1 Tax=Parafilimonas terrae TaxID=1465490 RepID=A0A1I5VTE7_9BACT|nr:hypothetical protein [Parafilimonas terrae]SFQ10740.1 hypothetical protein SAMN05444277_105177 [Parafilimonas terrae]